MTVLVIIEAVVIALLVVLVAGLLRSHAEILRRLHALDGGEETAGSRTIAGGVFTLRPAAMPPAEAIIGVTPAGGTVTIALTATRGLTVIAFMSSTCTACQPFWRSFREGVDLPQGDMRLVIVTRDPSEESPSAIADLAGSRCSVVMSSRAWDDFGVPASPFFVLVDAGTGAVIGEGSGPSWRRVSRMLADAVGDESVAADFDAPPGSRSTTAERIRHTDDVLRKHGITPADPSLWTDPVQDPAP